MRYWLAQLQQTVLNMQVYTGTDSNGSIEAHKDSVNGHDLAIIWTILRV